MDELPHLPLLRLGHATLAADVNTVLKARHARAAEWCLTNLCLVAGLTPQEAFAAVLDALGAPAGTACLRNLSAEHLRHVPDACEEVRARLAPARDRGGDEGDETESEVA